MSPDELGRHRIAEVRTLRLRSRWARLLGRNAIFAEHGYGREFLVRQIVTDRGAAGWGLSRRLPPQDTPDLTGRRLDELFDPARGTTDPAARELDFALHDLAGRILGEPVCRMLGGAGDAAVVLYGAATYMDDITPAYAPGGAGVVIDHCRRDYDAGYRAFKIKIGRGHRWMAPAEGLRRDVDVTRAVREHFPGCRLLVDANNAYTCEEFLDYFRDVADCGLFTIEEPFHENAAGLRRLREAIRKLSPATTVTEGESRPDVGQLLRLAEEGLVDVLNLDIEGYGLTPWRRLAPKAVARGLRLSPHCFDLRLKTYCAAHFLAGVGHADPLEGVIDQTEGVDDARFAFAEGVLHLPEAPGFGLELIWGRQYDRDGRDADGFRPAF